MLKTDLLPSWQQAIGDELEKEYMQQLLSFVAQEAQAGKSILPPQEMRFNALNSMDFNEVKVVILGQDPYPTKGHAHGLSFSVLPEVKPLPRSLNNINKELLSDLGIDNSHTGYLQPWADQGVLLLNTVLSVEEGNANSHQKKGWEMFTDVVIQAVSDQLENVVFILWGKLAQKKLKLIDEDKHLVLMSAHPSPLSARRGFFDSKPFSQTNAYLKEQRCAEIDWALPK